MIFDLTHNGKILTLRDATNLEIDQLKITLTKRIDNWRWDPRVKKGWWDGRISYFRNEMYVPSGLWQIIRDMCKDYNFELQINGLSEKFDRTIQLEEFTEWVNDKFKDHKLSPRPYQIETAFNIIKNKSCLAELATSAGKSLILYLVLAYLIEQKKTEKVLMIVPNVSLVVQATEDFYEYNNGSVDLKLEIQQIYAGSKIRKGANVVIGTYQSLVKKKKEYFDEFTTVMIDETHKAKALSIKTILEKCLEADRVFGVSGTIPKPDSLDRLTLMAYTGPVIQKVMADQLIKEGYISPVEVKVIEMSYAPDSVRESFQYLTRTEEDRKRLLNLEQNYTIQDTRRLEFITDTVLKIKKNCLVLFYRVEYGNMIFNKLRNKSSRRVFYIDGGTDKDLREEYKKQMEEGEGKILVASFGTFSTGINIKNLHVVALTESFKSDVIIRQSIGRGLRKHETKDKLTILDFVDDFRIDNFVNYLYRHSKKRREIYDEQRFPYEVKTIDLSKIYNKT
jgi:superfamily II DNA or RNA helicase